MLRAEFIEDNRAALGIVSQKLRTGLLHERGHKLFGHGLKGGEGFRQHGTSYFPVPRHRILAARLLAHAPPPAVRSARAGAEHIAGENFPETERIEVRQFERWLRSKDVAEGIRALVAKADGIRGGAAAGAVKNEEQGTHERARLYAGRRAGV